MMKRRLPADWEPQDAVLLGWPHSGTDWADMLDVVLPVFIRIAVEISRFEVVIIPSPDPDAVRLRLAEAGARLDRVRVDGVPTNDTWGSSFVAGPQGEILAQADTDREQTLVVTIDRRRSEQVRRIWPFLRDRRIDAYADLMKRYRD